jgi:Protein of unknown function (DUF1552)
VKFNRRQLLKALGLGALASPSLAFGQTMRPPKRVVFFVQPHGHVPSSWTMPIVGAPTTAFAERELSMLTVDEFPAVLKPLHPWRSKVLAIEGLSHTSSLEDIARNQRGGGGDGNNHNVAVASLLTASRPAQHAGFPCTGGSISIDQLLAQRTTGPGRFASRVYGGDYIPNQAIAPFSFLGPSQATPLVKSPSDAFADLLGSRPPTDLRQASIARLRRSALDSVAEEYRVVSSRLGQEGREKLEAHRALVRDLELNLSMQSNDVCSLGEFEPSGHKTRQFMRLMKLAFSCDLTRVMTYAAPVPPCPEFSYPSNADVHATYAHASVQGATSCGQSYTPLAEQAMTDLSVWYAGHLAYLLSELDSMPEGNGTMLDNTVVVWLTELGTPTHRHDNAFTVLIGGCQGFFKTGRYVRYPIESDSPVAGMLADWPQVGPAHNKLFVSLLNAFDQPDTSFGTTSATTPGGEVISMTGALSGLQR